MMFRNDLFVRRRDDEIALAPVLKAKHVLAHRLCASGTVPQVQRLQRWHPKLLSAGVVHLLADDLFDLAERPPCHREVRVDARRDLIDQSGAQHQPVADDLRLGRVVTQSLFQHSGNEQCTECLSGK